MICYFKNLWWWIDRNTMPIPIELLVLIPEWRKMSRGLGQWNGSLGCGSRPVDHYITWKAGLETWIYVYRSPELDWADMHQPRAEIGQDNIQLGYNFIVRTHAHAGITHLSMICIIRAWEAWSRRLSAFQILMMHRVGKCVISAWAWLLAFIPCPVRNIKAAIQKSHISTQPFSAWIVSWSWDEMKWILLISPYSVQNSFEEKQNMYFPQVSFMISRCLHALYFLVYSLILVKSSW